MNPERIIAGLDIGSAKTTVVIAEAIGERKSAPSAPTDSPRRQTRASRRRSSSVRFRPSASKTRKSFPPPAIFTNRLGRDMGAGV